MGNEPYQALQDKALNFLIKQDPHDIAKFRNLYERGFSEGNLKISVDDILLSEVWTEEEKIELFNLYGYDINDCYYPDNKLKKCIKYKNLTGFKALFSLGICPYCSIIEDLCNQFRLEDDSKYPFFRFLLKKFECNKFLTFIEKSSSGHLVFYEPTSLVDSVPCVGFDNPDNPEEITFDESHPMIAIIRSEDLKLIRMFLPLLKDKANLIGYAFSTKNKDVINLFINSGFPLNEYEVAYKKTYKLDIDSENESIVISEPVKSKVDFLGLVSPLTRAIISNDLKLVETLISNGVDVNLRPLDTPNSDLYEKKAQGFQKAYDYVGYDAIYCTPIEVALKCLRDGESTNPAIIESLYKAGAKFANGSINYEELICQALESGYDVESIVRYYFQEIQRKNIYINCYEIIYRLRMMSDRNSIISYIWMIIRYIEGTDVSKQQNNLISLLNLVLDVYIVKFKIPIKNHKLRELVSQITMLMDKETLKSVMIPISEINSRSLKLFQKMGFDFNHISLEGNSLLQDAISRSSTTESAKKSSALIEFGSDPNYVNKKDGSSPLSIAIKWGNNKTIKSLIDLSTPEIVGSKAVSDSVFQRTFDIDILKRLKAKGFKVSDKHFSYIATMIKYHLDEEKSPEIKTWSYLWDLYANFANKVPGENISFPYIESLDNLKLNKKKKDDLFTLIKEHLQRFYILSLDQIEGYKPDMELDYNVINSIIDAQDAILNEIKRYIGRLDSGRIVELLNMISIIDMAAIRRNGLEEFVCINGIENIRENLKLKLKNDSGSSYFELLNLLQDIGCCVDGLTLRKLRKEDN